MKRVIEIILAIIPALIVACVQPFITTENITTMIEYIIKIAPMLSIIWAIVYLYYVASKKIRKLELHNKMNALIIKTNLFTRDPKLVDNITYKEMRTTFSKSDLKVLGFSEDEVKDIYQRNANELFTTRLNEII
jgi:hypothetical protein